MFGIKTSDCRFDARHPAFAAKRRALATTSALAILVSALPGSQSAYAQTAPAPQTGQAPNVEEIVVTGTRIVRNGYEAPTPVTVVGVEALESQAGPDLT